MSEAIDIDEFINRGSQGAIELATAFIQASTNAMGGTVTYVYSDGEVIAAVNPPEAAERYEHAGEVDVQEHVHEETIPVLVRTAAPRRRGLFGLLG